jgi:hypothetical protein
MAPANGVLAIVETLHCRLKFVQPTGRSFCIQASAKKKIAG